MSVATSEPRVYSYLRFSSPEQTLGDSERRQLDGARRYAERKGLTFDESTNMADRGLSAFSGAHRKKGDLGRFLELVRAGRVAVGSTLVVENLDRLSREEFLTAFDTMKDLIRAGIDIHTISPEMTYSLESLNGGAVYQLVGQLQAAHAESKKKSERISAAWTQKRKDARGNRKLATKRCPAWLEVTDERNFKVIEPASETICMIYDWKVQGLGYSTIVRKLNTEVSAWQPPPNVKHKCQGWKESYVRKILQERAVLGEYQPHRMVDGKRVPDGDPILNYYPAIVSQEQFHAVRGILFPHHEGRGKIGRVSNLFTHLAVCGYCGEPMNFTNKGKSPKGRQYLRCPNAMSSRGCNATNFPYSEIEFLVLDNCPKLNAAAVLPNPDDKQLQCSSLRLRHQSCETQLLDIERRLDNLVDQIADTQKKEIRNRLQAKMSDLESQKVELLGTTAAVLLELRAAESDLKSFTQWKVGLDELRAALTKDDVELRQRMRAHLRQFIKSVECYGKGHPRPKFSDGDADEFGIYNEATSEGDNIVQYLEEVFDEHHLPRCDRHQFQQFLHHVVRRRTSRKGRFIRVTFTTGAEMRLVPQGSLADGIAWRGERSWDIIRPSIKQLWQDFKKHGVAVARAN